MLYLLPQLVINMALDSTEEPQSHRLSVVATGILTNVAIASRLRVLLMFLATVQHPLLFLRQQTIVHLRTQSVLTGKHISTLLLQASIIQTQATTIHVIRSRQEVNLLSDLLRLAPGGWSTVRTLLKTATVTDSMIRLWGTDVRISRVWAGTTSTLIMKKYNALLNSCNHHHAGVTMVIVGLPLHQAAAQLHLLQNGLPNLHYFNDIS